MPPGLGLAPVVPCRNRPSIRARAAIKGPMGLASAQPRGTCVWTSRFSEVLPQLPAMHQALLCLLLAGLCAATAITTVPLGPARTPEASDAPAVPVTVPVAPAAPRAPVAPRAPTAHPVALATPWASVAPRAPVGPDPIVDVQNMLAQLGLRMPLQPMPGLSCKDLQPMVLPGLSQLPPLPWALTQAALVLVQQGAGCHAQATALVRQLVRVLDMRTAQDLLRLMAQLNTAPARSRLLQLYRLALTGTGVPVAPCAGLTPVLGVRLWGSTHSTYDNLRAAMLTCNRLQAACAGVAPLGPHYYMVMWRRGIELRPAPEARAWLHRCSSAPRGRWRRDTEDACSPPGEDEVHRMLEWVPGISTLYNLGTSIYFAYEGCEEVASQRALEAAVDLGYDGLAVLSASAGGPVAYGIHLGLQPGLKAGVRGLIRYFTSDEAPLPAPTAHTGPVHMV